MCLNVLDECQHDGLRDHVGEGTLDNVVIRGDEQFWNIR